jgi:4-hydroxy-tetrahydrodipicolinate synthase
VLELAADAQAAGAAGVLLAPVSYQPLTPDDVFGLYQDVTAEVSLPLVVYDNPSTTRFTFTDQLHGAVAGLPHVASIKLPPMTAEQARVRIAGLRATVPASVTLGVSGDAAAAGALSAGGEVWYSVIGGILPGPALDLTRAALAGDAGGAAARSSALRPLWDLFAAHGSLRVTAAIAEHLALADRPSLPRPIRGLADADRETLAQALDRMGLTG